IAEYPTVITPQGRRKPDARQAIIDQVNRGTLLLNFTGHGNPTVWAHESILTLEDTKTQFFNNDRLAFVAAATCDWGRFDATDVQSSAEEMMKNQNGGAIGVLSATRAVYSTDNALLNYSFYGFAFPSSQFAGVPRLGDAFLLAKNDPSAGNLANREKYHLLCDPTLRLASPRMAMTVDSINGIATASTVPDTLGALQKVTIKGAIRKADLSVDPSVNGTALVTVYDAEREKTIPGFSAPTFTYVQPGAVLYKGENSVVNGRLEATFIVPKDISYDNKNGKISVYFSSGASDGRGYTTNFMVGGTARGAANDTKGPSISVYFDTPSFRSGDLVGETPKLIVALSDSSGINSAGTGIGHRIEAWVDGSAKSIDLTEYYKSKRDSYQEGTVEYPMPKLDAGSHSVLVKAWDVYNNPSTAEASFTVASGSGLSLVNVYNIPNPAARQTTFTFQHNQLTPLDVQIKIYSVAGRLIGEIDRYGVTDRFVQIPWDCRDNDGDALGNGVYFYRVTAKTVDGKFSSEALGRLAVVK
ncbi:MAG: type IX secretion system sortase PorU, partial [Acidobacteriota bacterium]